MRTVTFDPTVYKLVPVEASEETIQAACDASCLYRIDAERAVEAGIDAVPDDLPGVTVHSGEPAYFLGIDRKPLYLHPAPSPSQPSAEALKSRIAELEAKLEVDTRHSYDGIDCRNVTIKMLEDQLASQPSAEAIVQAALEAAEHACNEMHYNWRWDDEPDSDSGPRSCAAAIRALPLQQIIEEAKNEINAITKI